MMSPKAETPEKPMSSGTSMLNKPLPQILDELDATIASVAESLRKSELALLGAQAAARDASEAAHKAATAAIEGTRRELLGRIGELDKALAQERQDRAAAVKALMEENKQLRSDIAETQSQLNSRIDRLVMVVGNASAAMNDVYCQPKNGLKSV
jgi:chromosome segregation ATPase